MWSRTYCCCAVPLYNSGIYAIIAQFLTISLVSGILAFASPTIVAVAIPKFGPYLFGSVCIVVAAIQILGFFGVYRERPNLFKTYARFNALLVSLALILALAFIILSGVKHDTAVLNCEALFSTQVATSTGSGLLSGIATGNVTSASGICQIWTWVQLGIMAFLFVILTLVESYFMMYQSIYLSEQKADHARYDSVYTTAEREIRESGLWDHHDFANGGLPRSTNNAGAIDEFSTNPRSHAREGSGTSGLRNELGGSLMRDDSREYLTNAGTMRDRGEKSRYDDQRQQYGDEEIDEQYSSYMNQPHHQQQQQQPSPHLQHQFQQQQSYQDQQQYEDFSEKVAGSSRENNASGRLQRSRGDIDQYRM